MKKATFIDAHTHKVSTNATKSLVNIKASDNHELMPDLFSVGVHPWDVTKNNNFELVEKLVHDKRCYAIGETGLDRSDKYAQSLVLQKSIFTKHIQLSIIESKPLIIHCVKAFSDIIEILNQYQFSQKILFHDYNGNQEITAQLLRFDSYFSYGDKLFKDHSKGFKALSSIPLNKILFETDDSNREIQDVYNQASKLFNIELHVLIKQVERNFEIFISKKELDK